MTEKKIKKQILDYLKKEKVFHWTAWQGPMSTKGISDILGALPGGRLLAIEVKMPGKKPTALQQRFIDAVNRAGGLAIVARCVDDVAVAIDYLRGKG